MASKAIRERLKREAAENKVPPIEPKKFDEAAAIDKLFNSPVEPRPRATRKCCQSLKGAAEPHLPTCPTVQPRKPKGPLESGARLPHASAFALSYDAEKVLWTGTLHIGGTSNSFTAKKSGLLPLCRLLDKMYRESLAENDDAGKTETAAPA